MEVMFGKGNAYREGKKIYYNYIHIIAFAYPKSIVKYLYEKQINMISKWLMS